MAPAKMLLLPTLFVSLLLLMVPTHCQVDPTSTTPAFSQASSTLCGITTGLLQYRRIQCPKSADSTAVFPSPGIILPGVCMPDVTLCSSGIKPSSGEIAILAIVFCIFFVVYPLCVCLCYRTMKYDVRRFRLDEIMTMTDHFRTLHSEDTFSRVYEGLWLPDEIPVAVKRFKTELGLESLRRFIAELQTLSKIRHQYVVRLFGYCIKNNERILVFELMERGDLHRHLHPKSRQTRSELFSSWRMRVTVLFQAAQGIDYLHRYAEPRIIHRDIKAANILLSENWVATISNFEVAVIEPEPGSNYIEVNAVAGSSGYMDPDFDANDTRATPQNDVYSFGVIMLEVLTGRRPIDHTGVKLPDFAAGQILSGKLMAVLDRRLAVPAGHELEAITRVAQLAIQCVRVPGLERPDMSTVVTELEGVLALFDLSEASTS